MSRRVGRRMGREVGGWGRRLAGVEGFRDFVEGFFSF